MVVLANIINTVSKLDEMFDNTSLRDDYQLILYKCVWKDFSM